MTYDGIPLMDITHNYIANIMYLSIAKLSVNYGNYIATTISTEQ